MKLIYKAFIISLALLLSSCGEMVIKYLPEIRNDLNYINDRLDDKPLKERDEFYKANITYVRYFYYPKNETDFLNKVEKLAKEVNYNTKLETIGYKNTLAYFCHDSIKYRNMEILRNNGKIELIITVYGKKGYSSCVPKVK